jgi:phytanoyl-CoA hydroxylase
VAEAATGLETLMTEITNANLETFKDQGYLLARGLLDADVDLGPLVAEYEVVLDKAVVDLIKQGLITESHSHLPFGERMSRVLEESDGELNKYLDITLPQKGITTKTPMHCGPAVFGLLRNRKLLDAVERFIGPEIYSNPTQHVRIKPPSRYLADTTRILSEIDTTVWHQDAGTGTSDADETMILTVWISVTEAIRENGCLLVAPRSHRKGLALHCHDKRANYSRQAIPDRLVGPDREPIETRPGDVLFLSKYTMHSSLANMSDGIRWSLDLRYNPIGQPTGRAWFPGFVARSRAAPDAEMRDPGQWAAAWRRTREHLMLNPPTAFQRWAENDPNCA